MADHEQSSFGDKDPVKEFSQIATLAKMDWTPVEFLQNGERYRVRSYKYGYISGPDSRKYTGILFGLYSVSATREVKPIGYFSGEIVGDTAEFATGDFEFRKNKVRDIELDGLIEFSQEWPDSAVVIDQNHRQVDANSGVSHLLHSLVLATLSGIGVRTSAYLADVTTGGVSGRSQQLRSYDGTHIMDETGLIEYPSFYTKYSNVLSQKVNTMGLNTMISTKLTGYQWSLLLEAFKS